MTPPPPPGATALLPSRAPAATSPPTLKHSAEPSAPKPLIKGYKHLAERIALWCFVTIPLLAVVVAVPYAWGWGLGWREVAIGMVFFTVAGFGVTVGFHRYLTHGSFKAKRWLRIALAAAGCLGIEGAPTGWVAAHRRHHQFSDKEGDPHSPWRFGESVRGLTKGFLFAHMGWLFDHHKTNEERFAPDLLADKDIRRINSLFIPLVVFSVTAPGIIGALWGWAAGAVWWQAGLAAFFWGGLVRIAVLHHLTWSINSVCHIVGDQPFESKDKAANFWPLALFSFGEAWHNLHHADPTCARHGVLRGQIDPSARLIWIFEKFGWVYDVRWPKPERLATRRAR